MKTVQHIFFHLTILCCIAWIVGCQKEPDTAAVQLKYRVDAVKGNYDGTPDTRAIKNSWSQDDVLYIWYDDHTTPFMATYHDETWDVTPPATELVGTGKLYAVYGENATPTANGLSFRQGEICYTTAGTYTVTDREIVLNLPMTQRPQGRIVFTDISTGEELALQKMQSVQTVNYAQGKFDFVWEASTLSAVGNEDNTVAFYCLPLTDAGSNTTLYVEQNGRQYKRVFKDKKFTANKSISVSFHDNMDAWTEYNNDDCSKIVYTTTDGNKVQIPQFFGDKEVVRHIQTGDNEFTIECNGEITEIPEDAFIENKTLQSIILPASLTTIGRYAFFECSNLTGALTIPDGVITIGARAFWGCSGLTGPLTIPQGVTTIERDAFAGCSGLTGPVIIPDDVTTIEKGVFLYCRGLTSVTIPEGVTTIAADVFCDCSSLTSVTIPASVTEIGERAFWDCHSLTEVFCKPITPPYLTKYTDVFPYNAKFTLYVPTGCSEAYKSTWNCKIVETDF